MSGSIPGLEDSDIDGLVEKLSNFEGVDEFNAYEFARPKRNRRSRRGIKRRMEFFYSSIMAGLEREMAECDFECAEPSVLIVPEGAT